MATPAIDVIADGVTASWLVARMLDENGNPVIRETVTFDADTEIKLDTKTAVTDNLGQATVSATSKQLARIRLWQRLLKMLQGRRRRLPISVIAALQKWIALLPNRQLESLLMVSQNQR